MDNLFPKKSFCSLRDSFVNYYHHHTAKLIRHQYTQSSTLSFYQTLHIMSPLKTLESGVSSFILQVSESRPRQTSKLATLPTEIVYQIAKCIDNGNEDDYARDIRSLALSSANLFNIIRPLFYKAANYGCFTRALQVADVAMMERSYEFGDMELLPEDEVGGKCV